VTEEEEALLPWLPSLTTTMARSSSFCFITEAMLDVDAVDSSRPRWLVDSDTQEASSGAEMS